MIHLFLFAFLASTFSESPITPWGNDADLATTTIMTTNVKKETRRVKACAAMIRFFQNHISPIDGPRSHYYPTSSAYTLLAIQKHGVLKGIALGCDRLLRENSAVWVYPVKDNRKLDPVR